MKRNRILALGLSAILGVSAVPTDVKAFQSLANEVENSEITDVAVEENNEVENSLEIETEENEIVETEEQIKENEEIQSEEQVDIKNEIATLPLFDEDVEIVNTSEPTKVQELAKVDYSTITKIDLGDSKFEDLVKIEDDGSLSLFWFSKLPKDNKFEIVIPEKIKNITVKKITNGAFNKANNISKVTIEGDVEIGNFAFKESTITSLEAPNATAIGSGAFEVCRELTTVNAPKVTTIGTYAFSNSPKLTEANFPLVETLNKYAFNGCSELATIKLPNVTTISGTHVFTNCVNLTDVNLDGLKTVPNNLFEESSKLSKVSMNGLTEIK